MVKWIGRMTGVLTITAMIGVIVFGTMQVFFRYVLNQPLLGSEELARLLGVWMTFLGASLAFQHGSHIKVEIFHQRLSPKARRLVDLFIHVIELIFNGFVMVYGFRLTLRSQVLKSPALRFSMSFLFAAVCVGAFLSCIFLLQLLVRGLIDICQREGTKTATPGTAEYPADIERESESQAK